MKDYPSFVHHGAAEGVTGSCHRLLAGPEVHLLVDCGLFQGEAAHADSFLQHQIKFDISHVKALLLTHVHIDHVGRLPYLLAAGYKGPIYCSLPSARLLPLVIEDALKVGFTRDRQLIERFLATVRNQLVPVDYKVWHTIHEDEGIRVRARLQAAGHILGSAYIEVETSYPQQRRSTITVFSGDLGAPYAPLLPAPRAPQRADTLIIESTYGDRLHESRRERKRTLQAVLEQALQNQGTVMIPAFSIGRTQELLYELESLIFANSGKRQRRKDSQQALDHRGASSGASGNVQAVVEPEAATVDWQQLQIIVDSPLAAQFTQAYRELKPFWDAEALRRVRSGRHPLSFDNLYTIDSHEEHQRMVKLLADTGMPAVVIAASGMASGGRIVNYLRAMLGDSRHCVLFVGYQAPGTAGHALQQLGGNKGQRRGVETSEPSTPSIELEGKQIEVRAQVASIGGYSAHADRKDLLNFVRRMRVWPRQVRIVHGDEDARRGLQQALQQMAGEAGRTMDIVLPANEP